MTCLIAEEEPVTQLNTLVKAPLLPEITHSCFLYFYKRKSKHLSIHVPSEAQELSHWLSPWPLFLPWIRKLVEHIFPSFGLITQQWQQVLSPEGLSDMSQRPLWALRPLLFRRLKSPTSRQGQEKSSGTLAYNWYRMKSEWDPWTGLHFLASLCLLESNQTSCEVLLSVRVESRNPVC